MKIGVLSLQGDFKEHLEMLARCGVKTISVRLPEELKGLNGLIIPGGESTVIGSLMQRYEVDKAIVKRHKEGMALYGACAGAILLAKKILNSSQPTLRLLDISVKRNDYGRQLDSFETELNISKIGKFKGIFIRAPVIDRIGSGIEVLSRCNSNPVFIQTNKILASTFHPELADDARVHEHFIGMCG